LIKKNLTKLKVASYCRLVIATGLFIAAFFALLNASHVSLNKLWPLTRLVCELLMGYGVVIKERGLGTDTKNERQIVSGQTGFKRGNSNNRYFQ
jgi:hypothetical protein